MTYALQLANDPHFSYSEALIRALHFMMLQYELSKNPGRYRPGVIYVFDEKKQQNVYEGPDVEIVPKLMKELATSLNEKSDSPVMIRAAIGHLNLVMIHPFSDGNGRMARCLQTLILGREQIIEPPFCSIEEYLGRYTQSITTFSVRSAKERITLKTMREHGFGVNLIAHYRQASWLLQRMRMTQRVCGMKLRK